MANQDDAPPPADQNPFGVPTSEPSQLPDASLLRFSILDMLVLTALVAVNAGGWAYEPGIGLLVTLVTLPVAVRSLIVFKQRAAAGLPTSPFTRGVMLVGSLVAVAVVYAMIGFSLFGALWATCMAGLAFDQASKPLFGIGFVALALLLPVAGLWLTFRWVRWRWRRDTDPDRPQVEWEPLDWRRNLRRFFASILRGQLPAGGGGMLLVTAAAGLIPVAVVGLLVFAGDRFARLATQGDPSPWMAARVTVLLAVASGVLVWVAWRGWQWWRLRRKRR
ncbi:hypothetical protein Pla123a_22170 [Posidoniimonas polymericola]|uniref:Uncharacterized protein n=1 Tax=Posidoniimonas polymericola TaxID=2528002 RepID=A0A5C5YRK3_9BACT|nr:hypothetical protein [Posidoniimonas polymericola]TWT77556.1 hypothetical protein Pla123a_22170 [Posidoniimonas polymericola]